MKKPENMTTAELGLLFPVKLVPYKNTWPDIFLKEKLKLLENLTGIPVNFVEHIGSTAVAGLKAKDIIDILLETAEGADLSFLKKKMHTLGYHFLEQKDNPAPHMMFVKGYTPYGYRGQAYHVHVRYPAPHAELAFRELLISDHNTAREYEKLKQLLARKFTNDRESYTNGKTDFINKCLADCSFE